MELTNDSLTILALSDADRTFLTACGVKVPSDAAWPIDEDECNEKLTYDEAIALMGKAMKRQRAISDATGFSEAQ